MAGAIGIVGSVQSGSVAPIFQSNYIDSLGAQSGLSLISITAIYTTTVLIVFLFQSNLLYVIGAIGLGIFIPIGIIMRAFPFVRGIGGTLIAIGIGISIIYPVLLLALNLPVTNYIFSITSAARPGSTSSCPFSASGLACKLWSGLAQIMNTVSGYMTGTTGIMALSFGTNAASSLAGATALAGQGFWTGVPGCRAYGNGSGIFPALNFVIDHSLDQIVQFILFVLDIIIAYAMVGGIAQILGGKLTLGIGKKFTLA